MNTSKTYPINMVINGKNHHDKITPRTHLGDFLREHKNLTGTNLGCEHGVCGACTIEVNGQPVRSCITYAITCDNSQIRTIEGFAEDTIMLQLKEAFTDEHALQCGFCTPGMLISAYDIVKRKTAFTEEDVRLALSGNLCRCTGYRGIVNAVMRVIALNKSIQQVQ